jgi:hypothetical protein
MSRDFEMMCKEYDESTINFNDVESINDALREIEMRIESAEEDYTFYKSEYNRILKLGEEYYKSKNDETNNG